MMHAPVACLLIGLGAGALAGCGSAGAAADAGFSDAPATSSDSEPATDAETGAPALDADTVGGNAWQSLFNGVDLTGWKRYLGKPWNPSLDQPPLGLENDPRGVYGVAQIDGEPAIHITGEIFGALISERTFENFHLRLQYKWGPRTWPPLNAFDSGIMVLSTGPLGAVNEGGAALADPVGSGGFLVSMEYQLAPGDIGGLYNLGPIGHHVDSRTVMPDLPQAWNQVDIVFRAGTIEHRLNNKTVATGSGFQVTWPGQPPMALTAGKLQLQSENGEIYFRRVEVLLLP